jgi:hypothetical protein
MYDKVHTRGVLGSLSDAHKQTHHLGHKMLFLWVENMWIIGAKKWTECAQKHRYAAHINGNLGHSNGPRSRTTTSLDSFLVPLKCFVFF